MRQKHLNIFAVVALIGLSACSVTSREQTVNHGGDPFTSASTPPQESALRMPESMMTIEDLLGDNYHMVGNQHEHAVAWKQKDSGLVAVVEYVQGCVRKAYLTDGSGNVIVEDDFYRRCSL